MKQALDNKQSGNVLIYILGAIFLLGLLITMVKGSSTPGSNIDKESLLIRVAEVQSYGEELERAVAYIMRNGHSEVDIRFAHPDADPAYGDITDIPSRQVFSRSGGAAKYRDPARNIVTRDDLKWHFTGANSVGTVGSGDQGSSSTTELVATLPHVTKEFCLELNNKINLTNPSEDAPLNETNFHANNSSVAFNGSFIFSRKIGDTPNTYIQNTLEGCVKVIETGDTYHYYRVLLAR